MRALSWPPLPGDSDCLCAKLVGQSLFLPLSFHFAASCWVPCFLPSSCVCPGFSSVPVVSLTASLRTSHCLPAWHSKHLLSAHPSQSPPSEDTRHSLSPCFAPCFIRETVPFLSSRWSPLLQDPLRSHLYGAIFSEPQISGWGWGFLRWVLETRHPSQSPPCGPGRCRSPPEPGVGVTTAGPERSKG